MKKKYMYIFPLIYHGQTEQTFFGSHQISQDFFL